MIVAMEIAMSWLSIKSAISEIATFSWTLDVR